MTEEELAAIREHLRQAQPIAARINRPFLMGIVDRDMPRLLAEVDRLRAENAAVQSLNDAQAAHLRVVQRELIKTRNTEEAMRPIVEAVATTRSRYSAYDNAEAEQYTGNLWCRCGQLKSYAEVDNHNDDCPVTQARALLAKDGEA